MKKTFIFIAILAVLLTVGTTYAVTNPKITNRKALTDDKVQTLESSLLSVNSITLIKVMDGNVTCYITANSKYPDAIEGISCLK